MVEASSYIPTSHDIDLSQVKPEENKDKNQFIYGPSSEKKPKWWKRLAGRRGTKCQRAAIDRMSKYMIPKVEYGTYLKINSSQEIWCEIGFGDGANILQNAKKYPERIYFGAELYQPSVGNLCIAIENEQEQQKKRIMENTNRAERNSIDIEHPAVFFSAEDKSIDRSLVYSNVRIYRGDGTKLLRSLPSNSMSSISVTFPDPFANSNQEKWRIMQSNIICEIGRILKNSCGRFYLATDVEEYDNWTRKLFQKEPCLNDLKWAEVVPVPPRTDWLPITSQYEKKGLDEGRRTYLQCWELTNSI